MSTFNKPYAEEIKTQTEGLETLMQFIELVKNPEPLVAAHKHAREEATLTESQVEKYQEAVNFMKKYDSFLSELNHQKSELEAQRGTHKLEILTFNQRQEAENERITNERDAINNSNIALREREQALISREKKIEDDWSELKQKFSDAMTPIDEHKAHNIKKQGENETEAARLAELSQYLEKKKAALKKTLSDDFESE